MVFDASCLRAKCEQDHNLGYEMLKRFCNIITARLDATRLQLLDIHTSRTGCRPRFPEEQLPCSRHDPGLA